MLCFLDRELGVALREGRPVLCLAVGAMATIDPAMLQNLLQQVTEAARAATEASKSSASSSKATTSDWSKLLTKPSVFEYKSLDDEIRHFKEWSWQLTQYLAATDDKYAEELEDLSASTATRDRGHKLYGLLAGLLRGRALQTLKAVPKSDHHRTSWCHHPGGSQGCSGAQVDLGTALHSCQSSIG